MVTYDGVTYLYLFWLFLNQTNTFVTDSNLKKARSVMAPVFFRWSAGFELNYQQIRCATDQSSEDPTNFMLELYPEMKGL